MNEQPIYLVCATAADGERYALRRPTRRRLVVVTEVAQLRNVQEGFAFHFVSPPRLDLWVYVAEHGGADVAPRTFDGDGA